MIVSIEDATGCDGPGFERWLCDRLRRGLGGLPTHGDDRNLRRAMNRWRAGARVRFETVDRLSIEYGYTLEDVPEDLWIDDRLSSVPRDGRPRRGPARGQRHNGYNAGTIIEALELSTQFGSRTVANMLGVSHMTILQWRRGRVPARARAKVLASVSRDRFDLVDRRVESSGS